MQASAPGDAAGGDSYGSASSLDEGAQTTPSVIRPGYCAHRLCSRPLPPQDGPGRPRRFCSSKCRQQHGKQARTEAAAVPRPPRPLHGRFSERLRRAISDQNLKLATISRRLLEEDRLSVSPSTLSNWQNGQPPRRNPEDDRRIQALERVLRLRSGELLMLLDLERQTSRSRLNRPIPRPDSPIEALRASLNRRGGTSGYVTIQLTDTVTIDADWRERDRRVQVTVRAIENGVVDSYWAFYDADAVDSVTDFKVHSGCRIGRFVFAGELVAVELLFDRLLPLGGTHTFEFSVLARAGGVNEPHVRRAVSQPTFESLQMYVRFAVSPQAVWAAEWPTPEGPSIKGKALQIKNDTVDVSYAHPAIGMYGVEWMT